MLQQPSTPSSGSSFDEMDTLQCQMKNKGSMLVKTWTELFGIMTRYQAQLVTKHSELQTGDQNPPTRRELDEFKAEKDRLQKQVTELESKLLDRESEIVQLRTEVHHSTNEMLKKNELIRNMQNQISGKEAGCNVSSSRPTKRQKTKLKQQTINFGPSTDQGSGQSHSPAPAAVAVTHTVLKTEPEDMPAPSAGGQDFFIKLDEVSDHAEIASVETVVGKANNQIVGVPAEDVSMATNDDVTNVTVKTEVGHEPSPPDPSVYLSICVEDCARDMNHNVMRENKPNLGLDPHGGDLPENSRNDQQHTGEKPFSCELCHKRFGTRRYLQLHRKYHTVEKPCECDRCGKRFTFPCDLKRHLVTHKVKVENSPQCKDRKFPNVLSSRSHERVHTAEKPYRCGVCRARFAVSSTLVQHVRVHTAEKPYRCALCQKQFARSDKLVRHMRTIHTEQKP